MNIDRAKYDYNERKLTFDFDEWVALFKADPDAFEQRRLKWSELIVQSAPEVYRRRLSGLLFQINMEKKRSKNGLDSCLKLSQMMWEQFDQLKHELYGLMQQHNPSCPATSQQTIQPISENMESAVVLNFPGKYKLKE